jgi:dTDP-4-amino-4,6-dideoxygalactose transaminase
MFYLLTRDLAQRTALLAHLKAAGVYAVFHYVPLHDAPAGQRFGRAHGNLPVTREIADRLLRLPLFYGLDDTGVDQVIEAVTGFFRKGR